MKKVAGLLTGLMIIVICAGGLYGAKKKKVSAQRNETGEYKTMAYVTSGSEEVPDPNLVSHIYYAFAEIAPTFDAIEIQKPENLRRITALKDSHPELKVILSIGGYRKEGFSEMAASSKFRKAFAKDCLKAIKEYNLDGIDLDWEFPTTEAGGHTARPDDDVNYAKVVKELRKAIGKDKQISFYSNNSARWIRFDLMLPYVDYVMVSGYNLNYEPTQHQSNLYPSKQCGSWSVSQSVDRHMSYGVPPEKIMVGVPFYARTTVKMPKYTYIEWPDYHYLDAYEYVWDDEAKAPLYVDNERRMIASLDNQQSIEAKGDFIKDKGLAGMFYWHWAAEDSTHTLARTVNRVMRK